MVATNGQTDDDLLHPMPRTFILSKNDHKIRDHIKRAGAPIWEPGTLIRLLPDAVHIKIDSTKDISPSTPPPPVVPQRGTTSLASQLKLVGQMSDEGLGHSWYEGIASRGRQKGIPIFMRILPVDPRRFAIVHANGDEVDEQACVEWSAGFETPELRGKAVEKGYAEVMREIDANDRLFGDAARQYRVARRLWEIQVVRHEFFTRQNHDIFRPGTTRTAVIRAVRMGKADLAGDC